MMKEETKIELLYRLFGEYQIADELVLKILYEFGGIGTREIGDLKTLIKGEDDYSCLKPKCYYQIPIIGMFKKDKSYFNLMNNSFKGTLRKLKLIDKQLDMKMINTDGWWFKKQREDFALSNLELESFGKCYDDEDVVVSRYSKNIIVLQELRWRLAEWVLLKQRNIEDYESINPNIKRIVELLSTIGINHFIGDWNYDEDMMEDLIIDDYDTYRQQDNKDAVMLRVFLEKYKNEGSNCEECNLCRGRFPPFFVDKSKKDFLNGDINNLFDEDYNVRTCLYCEYVEHNEEWNMSRHDHSIERERQEGFLDHMNIPYNLLY